MKLPLQITYRHLRRSPKLDAHVWQQATALETYCDDIVRCHVLVERQRRHHGGGNRYHVHLVLTVPGEEIVVTHEPTLYPALRDEDFGRVQKATETDGAHTHVEVAIRDAFDVARRRLQDYARR